MKVAVGCDHAGFVLRRAVLDFLDGREDVEVLDCGSFTEDKGDDYPDIALKVAHAVASGEADRGVLICGTGIGVAITANKVRGIRAMACNDVDLARMSRAHNDLNVITLGGRVVRPEQVPEILGVWLDTPFEGGRHLQRVNKISQAEGAALCSQVNGRTVIFNHPLVQHKVGILRSRDTGARQFRELVQEIA
ncbi:MAG: ribose 5-phosphate isomerase B, partial [Fretibacterium sp.]|nr:ribose 5-phosphate isomerase B [Fretibacterium sp.]